MKVTYPLVLSSTGLLCVRGEHHKIEYPVIKMFSPSGEACFDEFMWHRHGPRKREPCALAFIEFSKRDESINSFKCQFNNHLENGYDKVHTFISGNYLILLHESSVESTWEDEMPKNV